MNDINEILEAAQAKPVAEAEQHNILKAFRLAGAICICVCLIMIIIEWFVFRRFDFGKPALISLLSVLSNLIDYHYSKKKSLLIYGIIGCVLLAFFLFMYIGALFV